jgi:hypothetical protein
MSKRAKKEHLSLSLRCFWRACLIAINNLLVGTFLWQLTSNSDNLQDKSIFVVVYLVGSACVWCTLSSWKSCDRYCQAWEEKNNKGSFYSFSKSHSEWMKGSNKIRKFKEIDSSFLFDTVWLNANNVKYKSRRQEKLKNK